MKSEAEAAIRALVESSPPLRIDWRDPQYWQDGQPVGHWIVDEIVAALDPLITRGEWDSMIPLGATIERLLTDGTIWGPEYSETGLLESLSNRLSWQPLEERRRAIEGFRGVLGPEGQRRWACWTDDLLHDAP